MVSKWNSVKPIVKSTLGKLLSVFITPDMAYVEDSKQFSNVKSPVFDSDGQIIDIIYAKEILKVFFSKYQDFSEEEVAQELSGLTCDENGKWTTNKLLWDSGLYLMAFDYVVKNNIFKNNDEFNDCVIIITTVYDKFVPICILQDA